LEDPLAEFILNNQAELKEGSLLLASLDQDGQIVISFNKKK
jgi:hypothetical protein